MNDLPSLLTEPVESIENYVGSSDDMTIAWRYQNLKLVESSIVSNQRFCHSFDLSSKMQSELINECNIDYWNGCTNGLLFHLGQRNQNNTTNIYFFVFCLIHRRRVSSSVDKN